MSRLSSAYDIARPTRRCAATDRELEPGERYIATLVELPGEAELRRVDFADAAWAGGARPTPPAQLFGFWHATVPEPNAPTSPLAETGELIDLFDQLCDTDGDPSDEPESAGRAAFRYLLALVLMRKKQLIYEGGTPADAARGIKGELLLRRKGDALPPERGGEGPPLIRVPDPGMDDDAIAEATERLGRILNTDTEADA